MIPSLHSVHPRYFGVTSDVPLFIMAVFFTAIISVNTVFCQEYKAKRQFNLVNHLGDR
ncbi:hypothetical protein [Nostoc sp. ATCC 53789]|uniref:hypothetical protein n=1 Tax=Nostoc sp. ATCC 53789 TaxID=76335 RepID=UPI00132E767B|nr:hypothetical protein [Nostoc sp. ATCC 53789]QHG14705.1 hypothetical protein GJB62_00970 [Nostoc sp. ATCC 53789]